MRRLLFVGLALCALLVVGTAAGSTPGADARLTNDCHPDAGCGAGYVSAYTLATGIPDTAARSSDRRAPAIRPERRRRSATFGSRVSRTPAVPTPPTPRVTASRTAGRP